MKCPCCNRRFHSKASAEAAARFKAIHDDLRLSRKITYSTTPDLSKRERHAKDSLEYRQQGSL